MVKIIADRVDIENHLLRLVDLINSNGGYVHDELVIVTENGDLSLQAPRSVPEKCELISVPRELLLPTADFDLYLSGDDICIGDSAKAASATQLAVAEEMFAIYNLCEKIKDHRKSAPVRLFLESPEIFESLVLPGQFNARKKLPTKDPVLDDFLHTRVFAAKSGLGDETHSVLMPIIDFLNHNRSAGGFKLDNERLFVKRFSPLADTEECFVSYSRMDAQIAYAIYGFVDESSNTVISVPLSIDLPGIGLIEIGRRQGAKFNGKIPEPLKNISWLVPEMGMSREDRQARMAFLIIPPKGFPRALRRVLNFLIRAFARDMAPEELKTLVVEAERQVVEANLNYYEELKVLARNASVSQESQQIVDDVVRVADIQLNLIRAYAAMVEQMDAAQAQHVSN